MALLLLLLLAGPHWFDLFDGTSLEGWTTTGGRYDGKARWSVEDGAIVGRQGPHRAGGLLYTKNKYRHFEIELECFLSYPFDSGIFVRMQPHARGAQVTLDYRPEGEVGGIYSDGWYHHNPEAKARWKKDQWNRCRVRCTGDPMRLQFWLNDHLVTDYFMPARVAPDGLIGLQVHGGRKDSKARFRSIRLREFAAIEYFRDHEPTDAGRKAGWRPFDPRQVPSDFQLKFEFRGDATLLGIPLQGKRWTAYDLVRRGERIWMALDGRPYRDRKGGQGAVVLPNGVRRAYIRAIP